MQKKLRLQAVQRDSNALCRSRRELSNAYLLARFGFDTAENEPSKVCRLKVTGEKGHRGRRARVQLVSAVREPRTTLLLLRYYHQLKKRNGRH